MLVNSTEMQKSSYRNIPLVIFKNRFGFPCVVWFVELHAAHVERFQGEWLIDARLVIRSNRPPGPKAAMKID